MNGILMQAIVNGLLIGISRSGLFVEYAAVPSWNAVKLPDEMPADVGVFIEPFSIACNAMEKGNVKAGDRIVVIDARADRQLCCTGCKNQRC